MTPAELLALVDDQLRRGALPAPGSVREADEHVVRLVADSGGWSAVVWSDLAHADVDAVIAEQRDRFTGAWEWKHYSHDEPADLPARLVAAGAVADPAEALMVGVVDEIVDALAGQALPPGVELTPVVDATGVAELVRVHDEVFGGDHAALGRMVLGALAQQPSSIEAVLAVADGRAVSAGRLELTHGTEFASLWGGGTVPAWRRRGVFRSLVAYRAAIARERGFRYLQVDASPDSRPILARLGFVQLAVTTPYRFGP